MNIPVNFIFIKKCSISTIMCSFHPFRLLNSFSRLYFKVKKLNLRFGENTKDILNKDILNRPVFRHSVVLLALFFLKLISS